MRRRLASRFVPMLVLAPLSVAAQSLTGALIGTVRDAQHAPLAGAVVRVMSPAVIGGPLTLTTAENGQLRFPALPPGDYELDVERPGFAPFHESDIRVGAGATIERTIELNIAGVAESVVVEGVGSRIEARDPGFGTRFGSEDLKTIPTRRSSMFDWIRAAPGISATSPGSGTQTTVSAFGSGTNENQFLIDGTNTTCPCNGVARSEPGVDFIQEVQVQSVGASAEFGNVQGAVVNVITKQGSDRLLFDSSYYMQHASLTSQPVLLPLDPQGTVKTGYGRAKYRDFTANLGGPAVRDRLWFFAGHQHLRDYDSQPGTDPTLPRTYEQNKTFVKLTWQLAPGWQLVQTVHHERWVNPEQPTRTRPFETTTRGQASVPAITFGHLTRTASANTVWDVRVGRFVNDFIYPPSTGDRSTPSHLDNVTRVLSGAPASFGDLTLIRTTAKGTIAHYRPGLLGADHQFKAGTQVERGEHHTINIIPTGVRYTDRGSRPFQAFMSDPSNTGGLFVTAALFATDAVTLGDRVTINAGVRFDHSRAITQDLPAVDLAGRPNGEIVQGFGTLYTWNVFSPRMGVTAKLSADGRTIFRASYGRFHQGVLTGEIGAFHPAAKPTTTAEFDEATGEYTRNVTIVDPAVNLRFDPHTRSPYTDEYAAGIDRALGSRLAIAMAYVRKRGTDYIGWTDIGGEYTVAPALLRDGRTIPVFNLANAKEDRRFVLGNPGGYFMRYDGLILVVEKRRARGWQLFGSYTFSRARGLLASSGSTASGPQVSTIAPPPAPDGITFGRDPNDLINARGRLANDRPHMLRAMGSVEVPKVGLVFAANLGAFSGKPWAATTLTSVAQNPQQRVQLEPRGTRRLSPQTLLDVRVSRLVRIRGARIDLRLDVLNLLNDTAEEGLAADDVFSPNFARPTVFMDPRRAMLGATFTLGR